METIAISNSTPNYLHLKLLELQKLLTLLELMGVNGIHRGPDSAKCATGTGELVQDTASGEELSFCSSALDMSESPQVV
ncbi:hypothetical protein MKW98_003855 [Papaver atlanticum]|uniref:Uncharacterized protein n=1 Tax=Papaver atlanticum TaxID=357466 RepID=A0AAD4TCW0_9MAGN|nr:hypothetical protein MKW98_003855 [Papaver atlanticum]